MNKKLIGQFDAGVVDIWNKGLIFHDPKLVAEAIDRGIDVNTPKKYSSGSAIASYVRDTNFKFSDSPYISSSDDERTNVLQVIDLILAEDPELLEKDNWGQSPADKCIHVDDNTEGAARVAIAAIHQSIRQGGPVYEINFDGIFSGLGKSPPGHPGHATRKNCMDKIEKAHDLVREKLNNPQTVFEKDLVNNHAEKIGFWLKPFDRPDIDALPSTSPEVMASLQSMVDNLSQIFGGRSGYQVMDHWGARKPIFPTPEQRATLQRAINDNTEATRHIIRQTQKREGPQ